jgi:hypothetical protein
MVGVPEIVPVDALRLMPAGSAGLTVKLIAVPVTLGVSAAMGWPTIAEIVVVAGLVVVVAVVVWG